METRLDEAKANIIRNAIINDRLGVGSEPWLEEHNITLDEFMAFLEYGVRLAAMYDWQERNMEVGSVETEITFVSSSSKVGDAQAKWTVYIDKAMTNRVDMVAQSGPVRAVLSPNQMVLPVGDGYGALDTVTGEVGLF